MDVETEYYPQTAGSCSKEQAVAKLLGWSIGPLFKRRFHASEAGFLESDLFWVENFEQGIDAQLQSMLIAAQNKAIRRLEEGAPFDELTALDQDIERVKSLVLQVHEYRMSMEDELAKGPTSELRLDTTRTAEEGVDYITLLSLNRWALQKYKVSTLAPKPREDFRPLPEYPQEIVTPDVEHDGAGLKQAMIAISLLADVVSEVHGQKYKHSDGKVNANALAARMSEIAERKGISKQGAEKLRKLVSKAVGIGRQEESVKAHRG
jgi:hypothetical protein